MRWAGTSSILLILALAGAGCVSPAEVTAALEAPLPSEGTPFVVLVTTCNLSLPKGPSVLAVYPDHTLYHLRIEAARDDVQLNADTRPPYTESERVALDVAATGALDLDAMTDENGRFLIVHMEKVELDARDMRDLQRRVTIAGFPALSPEYGSPDDLGCIEDHAAWVDGEHWTVRDRAGAAPWALHHVRDLVRELHAS